MKPMAAVSSTLREGCRRGDFAGCRAVGSTILHQRGSRLWSAAGPGLGFPTANVQLNRYSAPLSGVFAVRVNVAGTLYNGAAM